MATEHSHQRAWVKHPDPLKPFDENSFILTMSCNHVRGSHFMAMVPDCPQFYVMMWTQLAVHGLALFLEIILLIFPFYYMTKKYPSFRMALYIIMEIMVLYVLTFGNQVMYVSGGVVQYTCYISMAFIQCCFLPATIFATFAHAIYYICSHCWRFKIFTYKDLLISTEVNGPLEVHAVVQTKPRSPFENVLWSWLFGFFFGLVFMVICYLKDKTKDANICFAISQIIFIIILFSIVFVVAKITHRNHGTTERRLARDIEFHMEQLLSQRRPSDKTLTKFKEDIRARKTLLVCKMKEHFQIYRANIPIILYFGIFQIHLLWLHYQILKIGKAWETHILQHFYRKDTDPYYNEQLYTNDSISSHYDETPMRLTIFFGLLWGWTPIIFVVIFALFTLLRSDYYRVHLKYYWGLFGYIVKSDLRRVFRRKREENILRDDIQISNDPMDRSHAFRNQALSSVPNTVTPSSLRSKHYQSSDGKNSTADDEKTVYLKLEGNASNKLDSASVLEQTTVMDADTNPDINPDEKPVFRADDELSQYSEVPMPSETSSLEYESIESRSDTFDEHKPIPFLKKKDSAKSIKNKLTRKGSKRFRRRSKSVPNLLKFSRMTKRDSFGSLSSDVSTPMADILEEIPETVPSKEPGIDEQSAETSQARTSSPVTESSEKPTKGDEYAPERRRLSGTSGITSIKEETEPSEETKSSKVKRESDPNSKPVRMKTRSSRRSLTPIPEPQATTDENSSVPTSKVSKKSLEDRNKAENPDIEKEKQPEENADQKSLESSEDGNFEQVFDFGF